MSTSLASTLTHPSPAAHSHTAGPDSESDTPYSFFPILPYSYDSLASLDRWSVECGSRGSGLVRSDVWDEVVQEGVIELMSSAARALPQSLTHTLTALNTTNTSTNTMERSAAAASASETSISFPQSDKHFIGTPLHILNLQLRSVGKYVRIEVEVEDTQGKLYTISASNSGTLVRLQLHTAHLPLELDEGVGGVGGGWNRLRLDLTSLVRAAFDAEYAQTHRVTVHASCRIRRIFFSDDLYADAELPPSLRAQSQHRQQ